MRDEFFTDEPGPVVEATSLAIPRGLVKKVNYADAAHSVVAAFLEEHTSLEAYVRLRNILEVFDEALSQIKENAIAQVEGNSQLVLGALVQLKSLPRKWEYTDPALDALEAERIALDVKIKARKKVLESLKEELVDPRTGEITTPARCVSQGVTLQVNYQ